MLQQPLPLNSLNPHTLERVQEESIHFHQMIAEISKAVIGNQSVIEALIMTVLCRGHVLLEGVPGVAKTTMIKALTHALGLDYKRVQFTPDLLPADVIGTLIYNQKTQEFDTKKGPIFTNVVLADEINRASAKVQSAFLQAMQEGQVTIGNMTFTLEEPFFVFATQNPFEQEGTYRLPEAQIDRFFMKLLIGYPTSAQEKQIVTSVSSRSHMVVHPVVSRSKILEAQRLVREIYVDDRIVDYIISLIFALRHPEKTPLQEYIASGPSPRATLDLYSAAQALAFLKRRHFVIPDDVKAVACHILRHRVITSYPADADRVSADMLINEVLLQIKSP
jgi:MoxR-like ATPase